MRGNGNASLKENLGIGSTTLGGILSLGNKINSRSLALYDSPTDWYGLGIQPYQLRFQVGSSASRFSFFAGDNTELLTIGGNGKVGIGTTTLAEGGYKLFVKEGIRTEKVKVDVAANNGWADYVFEPSYQLPSLTQVETFIKANKHLPDVPSEKEVKAEGIDVAIMDGILLKKIEELTLYVIEKEKELKLLRAELIGIKQEKRKSLLMEQKLLEEK